jgi:hypothetical protein
MRRRATLIALAAGLVLLAACEPIHPDNRPLQIPNVANGRLPGDLLRDAGSGCLVHHEAVSSLRQMIAHAAQDNVRLTGSSCYRDYDGQVAARERACSRGECHMAAVPGNSNHGWGKAVDFRDQNGGLTFTSVGYRWLEANAWLYGWNHPGVMKPNGSVPEPWHWEWVGDGGRMFPRSYWGVGNPTPFPGDDPQGRLDQISVANNTITARGWALDPNSGSSIAVRVHVDGVPRGTGTADQSRPDVATAHPPWGFSPHGYSVAVPLQPGDVEVCVYGINVGAGSDGLVGCRSI